MHGVSRSLDDLTAALANKSKTLLEVIDRQTRYANGWDSRFITAHILPQPTVPFNWLARVRAPEGAQTALGNPYCADLEHTGPAATVHGLPLLIRCH